MHIIHQFLNQEENNDHVQIAMEIKIVCYNLARSHEVA